MRYELLVVRLIGDVYARGMSPHVQLASEDIGRQPKVMGVLLNLGQGAYRQVRPFAGEKHYSYISCFSLLAIRPILRLFCMKGFKWTRAQNAGLDITNNRYESHSRYVMLT